MIKNLHLLVSIVVLAPIAVCYGVLPNHPMPGIFDFTATTIDQKNILRAIMCSYLAIVALWALGIIKPRYWAAATITCVFFMGGLAVGRLISLAADGWPSPAFSIGLIFEGALALWGWRNLKRYGCNQPGN
jgi:hypothetical protein